MRLENSTIHPSFKRFIYTPDADKLLIRGDKIIKSLKDDFVKERFLTVCDIPGHKRPLWSVIKEYLSKTQKNNENHIIIDMVQKGRKKLINIMTMDSKGYRHSERTVSPFIEKGTKEELFGNALNTHDQFSNLNIFLGKHKKIYAKSEVFDAINTAQTEVEELAARDKEAVKFLDIPEFKIKKEKKSRQKKVTKSEDAQTIKEKYVFERSIRKKAKKAEHVKPEKSTVARIPRKLKKSLTQKTNIEKTV